MLVEELFTLPSCVLIFQGMSYWLNILSLFLKPGIWKGIVNEHLLKFQGPLLNGKPTTFTFSLCLKAEVWKALVNKNLLKVRGPLLNRKSTTRTVYY